MLSEALLGAITEAVFSYLLEQAGLADHIRARLGRDAERLAFQVALARAYTAFARRYPQWAATLFDEPFLRGAAAPLLARCLMRDKPPQASELASAWADQLAWRGETRAQGLAEVTPAAADFLQELTAELRARREFQALFDSQAAEKTAAATAQTAQDLHELIPKLDQVLTQSIESARQALAQQRDPRQMLRVLVVLAGPVAGRRDGDPAPARLDLRAEWKLLADAVLATEAPIALIRLRPPIPDALRYALGHRAREQGLTPHVVHFTGHGWEDGLLFEDDLGRTERVRAAELVEMFHEAGVALAVLNACHTAAGAHGAGAGQALGLARALVQAGVVQATVGHRQPVADPTAVRFVARLYAELTRAGATLEEAMRRARMAIAHLPDAQVPVLVGDGSLTLPAPCGGQPYVDERRPAGWLPSGAAAFFGRGERLIELARWMAATEGQVLVLSGVAGIGKSALAMEAAERNAWRFPGGVSAAVGPRTPELAQSSTAQALLTRLAQGLELEVKPGDDPALELQRHCARQPTLLLLDNLEQLARYRHDQALELARFLSQLASPSKALVTLRPPLPEFEDLPTALALHLVEGLEDQPGTNYVLHLAWQKNVLPLCDLGAARELARRLHGHPKLIEVAVPRACRPGGYVALQKELPALSGDLEEALNELIGWSAEQLTAQGSAVLRLLPLFPAASCTEATASAALGAEALPGLRELFDVALADYQEERYVWHQSVLDYALKLPPWPEKEAAQARLCGYYSRWGREHSSDYPALAAEQTNMLAALEWAWQTAGHPADAGLREVATQALVYDCLGLREFWGVRGFWQERLAWLERAVTLGQGLTADEERKEHSTNLHHLAITRAGRGDYATARDLYAQSAQIDKELGNRQGLAATLHAQASLAQDTGDYATARDLYAQSAQIEKELGNRHGLAATLHQMASLAQDTGDYATARDLYAQSRTIKEELGNRIGWAQTTFMLGWLHWQQAEAAQAILLWEQVLPIFEQAGVEQALAQQGFPVREALRQARAGRTAQEWLAQRAANKAAQGEQPAP